MKLNLLQYFFNTVYYFQISFDCSTGCETRILENFQLKHLLILLYVWLYRAREKYLQNWPNECCSLYGTIMYYMFRLILVSSICHLVLVII